MCVYLHHEKNSVENNESHDEIFEGGGDDNPPQFVLETVPLLRHVPLQRFRVDRKINAGFLETKINFRVESTFLIISLTTEPVLLFKNLLYLSVLW